MKNKKGDINWTVAILLAIIFFFILTNIGNRLLGKSGAEASDIISSTGDEDKDNVPNISDICPCTYGSIENEGCPTSISTQEEKRKHKEKLQRLLKKYDNCEEVSKLLGLD